MPWTQEFKEGDRVTVRQGRQTYPGTVLSEATGIDFTHYYVLLDDGQGEGWWSENEMAPTSIRATAAHTAEVQRRLASEDYPELDGVLEARPDLPKAMDETEYMRSLSRTAIFLPLHGPGGESPRGNGAYDEGFRQGQVGTTQEPSSHDPAYMADYRLGWAAGIKSRSQVPEPRSTDTLHADEPNLPEMFFDPDMGGPGPMSGHGWVHSAALARTAGIVDFLMGSPEPSDTWAGPGRNWSHDWCRFRRESHCWLPKELNREASEIAGYAVWVPEDRGHCKRVSWEAQKECPVPSQPGPNVPGGFTDATVAWEDGGQRGGIPRDGYATEKIAAKADDSFAWHYTAAWSDVREKAREIARGGKVRVLSVKMFDELHPEFFYGQVMSPTGSLYNPGLTFVPGTWQVGAWECDCAWSSYAWGRTRQWVKYEGRMCAHALALVYEMQSQSMRGVPDDEDEIAPDWVPKAAAVGKVTREDFPVVQALLDSGASVASVQAALHHHGVESAKVGVKGTIRGKVNGQVTDLEFADGQVLYHGQPYHGPVFYPDYHPYRGLNDYTGSTKEADVTAKPDDPGAWGLSLPEQTAPDVHEANLSVDGPSAEMHEADLTTEALRTTAADVFSRKEQDEIIGEGEGRSASNLDRLDLKGTHYAPIDEMTHYNDDPDILWP